MEIVGHIVIVGIFLASVFKGFKYLSTKSQSIKSQVFILLAVGVLPVVLFGGLTYLNRAVDTPVVHFGNTGSLIIGMMTALFIAGLSLWAKTWILIVVVSLLVLPDYLLSRTSLKYETQLIMSSIITFGGMIAYLCIISKLDKNK